MSPGGIGFMERVWRPQSNIEVETDPRFPSGKWIGFWVQRIILGRQYMSLQLTFAKNQVSGEGSDRVGDFIISGEYDLRDGRCVMHKRYIDAHDVLYEGRNEDDGMWLWGLWTIRSLDRGGFHLWPEGENDPTGRDLKAEKELPRELPRVRLAPAELGI
jgi:hypothetical protein